MLAQGVAADDTDKQLDETNQHDDVTDAQTTEDAEDDSNKMRPRIIEQSLKRPSVVVSILGRGFPMLKGAPMVLQKQKNTGGDGEKNEQAARQRE
ncbi:hypothetical protein QTG54_001938 [Skeletonema marinoi]|uniref:Uncharacterized protein n=1 Tax=Skeletonema marinoi TaxID=267567 RepID=A0AAD9DJG7_9STRA|nr:hypothetical protein QTG54_001938 [Skeletonema marinoi]